MDRELKDYKPFYFYRNNKEKVIGFFCIFGKDKYKSDLISSKAEFN